MPVSYKTYNPYDSYNQAKLRGEYIFKEKYHFDADPYSNLLMSKLNTQVRDAYGVSAKRLEGEASRYFNSVQDFQQIVNLQKQILNRQYSQDEFFAELNQFVEKDLLNSKIDGVEVRRLNTYKPDNEIWKRTATIADDIDKVVNRINAMNSKIFTYLKSHKETAKTIPKQLGEFFFLDRKELSKAKKQYDDIIKARDEIRKLSGNPGSVDNIKSMLNKVAGSLAGDIKGSIKEYSSYMLQQTADELLEEFAKQTGKNIRVKVELTGNTSNIITDLKGTISKKFASKSDTVSYFYEVDANRDQILIGMAGTSVKSHSSNLVGSKHHIATAVRWDDLFLYADLLNKPFEYLFLNSIIHTPKNLDDRKLNNYLAAKASAFLISGAFGGSNPQAMFMEYSNKVWYVPDLLRTIEASTTRGLFKLKISGVPSNINDTVETYPNKCTNALIRKNIAMKTARAKIKFSATGVRS